MPLLCFLFAACGTGERQDGSQGSQGSQTAGAMVIQYRPDSADTFVAARQDSVIALDWLREVASIHDISLETRLFSYGTLVERIGPRRNGEGGYWLYKVNGQMVPKSSDAHRVAWSDTVTFLFDER